MKNIEKIKFLKNKIKELAELQRLERTKLKEASRRYSQNEAKTPGWSEVWWASRTDASAKARFEALQEAQSLYSKRMSRRAAIAQLHIEYDAERFAQVDEAA